MIQFLVLLLGLRLHNGTHTVTDRDKPSNTTIDEPDLQPILNTTTNNSDDPPPVPTVTQVPTTNDDPPTDESKDVSDVPQIITQMSTNATNSTDDADSLNAFTSTETGSGMDINIIYFIVLGVIALLVLYLVAHFVVAYYKRRTSKMESEQLEKEISGLEHHEHQNLKINTHSNNRMQYSFLQSPKYQKF
eukprot:NODE_352_length_8960_cov_1.102697.p6 type:complete len:190 gc:universal NODE_352_length_8960_cov_1.102697:2902-3471(+)